MRSTASANGRCRRINSSSALEMASNRSAALELARTSTIPHSMSRARSGAATRNAYPIPVVPGSIPRITDRLGVLQDLFGHVEVRVDLDDVVEILECLDEAQELLGLVALDPDRGGRAHRELGGSHLDAGRLERLLHALERRGRRVDGDETRLGLDILGACVDRRELDHVGVLPLRIDLDDAFLLEEPLHRTRFAELSAAPGERGADLRHGPVPVVGCRLDHHRDPARGITLVDNALEGGRIPRSDGSIDRALDGFAWHVHVARAVHREPKAEIPVGIAAALLRGDHDLFGHLRENNAALDVRGALLALDLTPL